MTTILLQPGIYNSGPTHWQSLWQAKHQNVQRVQQQDWDHPDCSVWAKSLDEHIAACQTPPVLVAHSLGCLVAARWCASSTLALRGLLLVAVPNPRGPNFPADAHGFDDVPASLGGGRIPLLVSSENDPYSSSEFTERVVRWWSARHISLGKVGHINSESGLGDWDYGWNLVRQFLA